jgi:hypothetical protein
MSAAQGFVAGGLGLIALQVAATRGGESASGVFAVAQKAVSWLTDPSVPGIPDKAKPSGPTAQQNEQAVKGLLDPFKKSAPPGPLLIPGSTVPTT